MAQALLDNGWPHVRPLLGGFDAWLDEGFPTEPKGTRSEQFSEVASKVRGQ